MISEHWDAGARDSACYQASADTHVMVSEDRVPLWALKSSQDLGTAARRMIRGDKGQRSARDEVSSEQNYIGRERVDMPDDAFQKEWLRVLVKVDVTDLRDTKTVKS